MNDFVGNIPQNTF